MRITREEFKGYMENWDDETRRILGRRMEERFRRAALEHFSPDEAGILKAALGRMIPQREEEEIDLVGFVDWALGKPLGRGDRQGGMPDEETLFRNGLVGIQETAYVMFREPFTGLLASRQDEVLRAIQEGTAQGETWRTIPPGYFFSRLMMKALTGFCAHPFSWMRMGFPGPGYPEGYVWITAKEIMARRHHFPGWKTL